MRTRIIALIVLAMLIGIPTYLYWHYYKKNISSFIFLIDNNEPFTVSLVWRLEYRYFPLLDQVFHYKSTCTSSCIFTPIPPLIYDLRISTPWREDIVDRVVLKTGESKKYQVALPQAVFFERVASMPHAIPAFNMESYTSIGVSSKGKVIAIENKLEGGSAWVIHNGKFISLFRSPASLLGSYLDASREFLISPNSQTHQLLFRLTGTEPGIVFPTLDTIIMVTNDEVWKVRTEDALYEYIGKEWKKNPRFTDYINLNNRYRLGYISDTQWEKLQLQNFPKDDSILILLDRVSQEVSLVRKDMDIKGFFFYDGIPAYLDNGGDIYRIILKWYE